MGPGLPRLKAPVALYVYCTGPSARCERAPGAPGHFRASLTGQDRPARCDLLVHDLPRCIINTSLVVHPPWDVLDKPVAESDK